MRFLILNWFGQKNPYELLNNHLKYFRFWLRIHWDVQISCIPRIIRIRKFSFRLFSEYGNFHPAYYLLMLSFSELENTFCVFSVYAKFRSSYAHYTLNFIPRFLLWVQFLSTYYQYTDNVIQRSIHKRKVFLRSITYSTEYQYALNFILHIISIS